MGACVGTTPTGCKVSGITIGGCSGRSESNCNAVSSCGCRWDTSGGGGGTTPAPTSKGGSGGGGADGSGCTPWKASCTNGESFTEGNCDTQKLFGNESKWQKEACSSRGGEKGTGGGKGGGKSCKCDDVADGGTACDGNKLFTCECGTSGWWNSGVDCGNNQCGGEGGSASCGGKSGGKGGGVGGGDSASTCESGGVTARACYGVGVGGQCTGFNGICQKTGINKEGLATCGCKSLASTPKGGTGSGGTGGTGGSGGGSGGTGGTPTTKGKLGAGKVCFDSSNCESGRCERDPKNPNPEVGKCVGGSTSKPPTAKPTVTVTVPAGQLALNAQCSGYSDTRCPTGQTCQPAVYGYYYCSSKSTAPTKTPTITKTPTTTVSQNACKVCQDNQNYPGECDKVCGVTPPAKPPTTAPTKYVASKCELCLKNTDNANDCANLCSGSQPTTTVPPASRTLAIGALCLGAAGNNCSLCPEGKSYEKIVGGTTYRYCGTLKWGLIHEDGIFQCHESSSGNYNSRNECESKIPKTAPPTVKPPPTSFDCRSSLGRKCVSSSFICGGSDYKQYGESGCGSGFTCVSSNSE